MGINMRAFILILSCFSFSLIKSQGAVVVKDDIPAFKKEYRVVLMLPFCIGMSDKWKVRETMAEYYEGVELAIEELEKQGMKMNLVVLDTKMDSLEVIRLLSDPEMQETDLFIGPVYDNELVEVEKFCATYKIPLVSPLRYYPKTTGADFPLINCTAVDSLQYFYFGKHASQAFRKFQVIVVDDAAKNAKTYAARNFKKGYESASGRTCQIIDGKVATPASVWNGKDSLLIYYPGKGASSCSNGLSIAGHDKWIVAGPADWLGIERVNYNVFNGVYFYDAYSIPYNDTAYKSFRQNFRSQYGGDPERYTFIGYDQFLFFGTSLMAWDGRFYKKILNKEFTYMHRTFNFVQRGNLIENAGMNLFYYQDYKFYKAFWRY
jgi:ABC-type branched-subunit amino acid transport system substrate-binding protein